MAWVHEHIFAGGGDHIPATWEHFSRQIGIQAVVHLSSAEPMSFQGGWPASFLWLDIEEEHEAGFAARALCGRFVQSALAGGENVLLHSGHGRHRTRWIYVSYLICSGRQLRSALRLAEEKPWQAPYHTDHQAWVEFQNYLREP